MTTTGETVSGSAPVQGELWGARARDFTTVRSTTVALPTESRTEIRSGYAPYGSSLTRMLTSSGTVAEVAQTEPANSTLTLAIPLLSDAFTLDL